MKKTKFNWMVFDLGYGLGVCPRECQEALIPNVAAVQHAIVKFKSPQNDEELSDQLEICRLVAAAPELLAALERCRIFLTAVKVENMPENLMIEVEAALSLV